MIKSILATVGFMVLFACLLGDMGFNDFRIMYGKQGTLSLCAAKDSK